MDCTTANTANECSTQAARLAQSAPH